jgi:glutamate-1-semialdehyde 2,1-aminomutase
MPVKTGHGLYFAMPHRSANKAMNEFVREETKLKGTSLSRVLKVITPQDDREQVAKELRAGLYCNIKAGQLDAQAGVDKIQKGFARLA